MTVVIPATRLERDCGCDSLCECDDPVGLQRTRFFERQRVGPEDLTQDQRYFREKQRRHNRMLHGWGVVCGVRVRQGADENGDPVPYTVCVEPGYVLGPCGDEIIVERTVPFDVRRATGEAGGECPPPADPWCSPVRVDRDPDKAVYLAIRYDECLTRPVQVESGCGCGGEDDCEYSRVHDGYVLGILEEPPETRPRLFASDPEHRSALEAISPELGQALECTETTFIRGRTCPHCPTSPWVVLADLFVHSDGKVVIDQTANRRWVASFGSYAFWCSPRVLIPLDQPLDDTTRDTVFGMLTAGAREEASERVAPRYVLELPATVIRGVGRSAPLADAIGGRTIEELAKVDVDHFVEEATSAGAREDAARQIVERARVVTRLTGGGDR